MRITIKKFKMLGKNRYKINIFDKYLICWDFSWHGNLFEVKK